MTGTDTFGARVRKRRDDRGLTQEQLAREVGVTLRQLQRIETGQTRMPRLQRAQDIASYFGESLESLVPERAHEPNLPGRARRAPHGTSEKTTDRDALPGTPAPRSE